MPHVLDTLCKPFTASCTLRMQEFEAAETACFCLQEDARVPDLLLLTCTQGPCEGSSLSKAGTVLSVGRTGRSKICVKDPSVSEKHASFEWDGRNWLLQDLGSSNGTRINGESLATEGVLTKNA